METLLAYLCQKYFAGETDGIKEYNIGVEALGRKPSFDPSTDAIARVEVHRLRRKLRDYYETEGAGHNVRITIPVGSYAPVFMRSDGETLPEPAGKRFGRTEATVPAPVTAEEKAVAVRPGDADIPVTPALIVRKPAIPGWLAASAGVVLLLSLGGAALFRETRGKAAGIDDRKAAAPTTGGALVIAGDEVRILCGQDRTHLDKAGKLWGPDRFGSGGGAFSRPRQFLSRTDDSTLYEHGRTGPEFHYDIPLSPGTYELHLYFAETTYGPGTQQGGGETSRLFNVDLNGVTILTSFDILSDAPGPGVADERVFRDITAAKDGKLHLTFTGLRDQALVDAIALIPAPPHRMNPVRISAQDISYTDSKGQIWAPDNYFTGGSKPFRTPSVHDTPDPNLYAAERFGNFSYDIPVAPGAYEVNMYVAETYWGPETAPQGAAGLRVFDIYCNGTELARKLDLSKQGGFNHAVVLHYAGLRPNPQGKLMLSFVPEVNYATLCALEVLPTGE
jgi:hypothetical protein